MAVRAVSGAYVLIYMSMYDTNNYKFIFTIFITFNVSFPVFVPHTFALTFDFIAHFSIFDSHALLISSRCDVSQSFETPLI